MKKNILIILLFLGIICLLNGCATPVVVNNYDHIQQQNLLRYCTTDTPVPKHYTTDVKGNKVYTGEELLNVLVQYSKVYNDCAVMHDALVNSVKTLQDDIKLKVKK